MIAMNDLDIPSRLGPPSLLRVKILAPREGIIGARALPDLVERLTQHAMQIWF
jgi:hypothetical protein